MTSVVTPKSKQHHSFREWSGTTSLVAPKPKPYHRGKSGRYLLVLLVLLNVVLGIAALRYVIQPTAFTDEVEHAHVLWALNQGIMPYEGIHQNHAPLLWMISAPIMAWLPKSAETMIALRGMSLLAFVGIYFTGLLVLREILGPIHPIGALVMLLLSLSVLPIFELYRYRSDPLMALFAALAILAAVRLRRAPLLYSVVSGIALGLAASSSPKMAPLCLLVPTLCLLQCYRWRTLRPLWLVVPNGVGFVVGLLPMVAWLCYHGLLDPFWQGVVAGNHNCHGFNLLSSSDETLSSLDNSKVITILAILGGLLVVPVRPVRPEGPKESWPPISGLLVAALLAWLVLAFDPTHAIYNLQAFAMPAAVLGTVAIVKLAELDVWPLWQRLAMVGVVLVFVAERPTTLSIGLVQKGRSIRLADMQPLMDLCKSDDATCVGFAPWHPVFCRDATKLYLNWDLQTVLMPWISATGKQPYREMWRRAISDIEHGNPTLIVDNQIWAIAHENKVIDDDQYNRFLQVVKSRYESVTAGKVTAFVRKGTANLGPSNDRQPTDNDLNHHAKSWWL